MKCKPSKNPIMFIFFACPKKMNQKKGHFYEGFFVSYQVKNRSPNPAPRLIMTESRGFGFPYPA